ncbi:MAG: D-glycero-D-manno-heptose 1,7-bisphosphate phosphatase [Dinoroseobacter sp.]|jgi:D-glycero-D-manno-heptose 1,7-bisphosphate phosphatase
MKLIILDRDGVINKDSAEFIKTPEEWIPIKGSLEAIARLSQAGYDVVIITNQSGIGRGLISADMLGQIHVRMIDYIRQAGGKIQSILFCPHLPSDDCDCRKPEAGLYRELAEQMNISYSGVYSVGDSERDLLAAKEAGAVPILVKTGNGKKTKQKINADSSDVLGDVLVFDNLSKFVDALVSNNL